MTIVQKVVMMELLNGGQNEGGVILLVLGVFIISVLVLVLFSVGLLIKGVLYCLIDFAEDRSYLQQKE